MKLCISILLASRTFRRVPVLFVCPLIITFLFNVTFMVTFVVCGMWVNLLSALFVMLLIKQLIVPIGINVRGVIKLVILQGIVKMYGIQSLVTLVVTLPLRLLLLPPPTPLSTDPPPPADSAPTGPSGSGAESDGLVPLV